LINQAELYSVFMLVHCACVQSCRVIYEVMPLLYRTVIVILVGSMLLCKQRNIITDVSNIVS